MSKKLLFFTKMNFAVKENSGIRKKVFAQARAFRALGFEVDVLFFENNTIYIEGDNAKVIFEAKNKLQFLRFLYGGFFNSIDFSSYKYVYIRHFLTNPLFLTMLKNMKRQTDVKLFMEIPTYPYQFEFKGVPLVKKVEAWLDQRCVNSFKKYIDRIVTFSPKKEIFGIRTILSDNGIDIDEYPILPRKKFDNKTLHVFGLANIQTWHGYDRFIEGLKIYCSKPKTERLINVIFHVGGEGPELANLKALTEKYGLPDKVIFYGYLSGDQLSNVFQKIHLGIDGLGLHRKNVANGETSSIKAREFAARGIPNVNAYRDRGFPENFPFLLELPADESPISIDKIIEFYLKIEPIEDYPEQINAYAGQNLTWTKLYKPVADAFRNQ